MAKNLISMAGWYFLPPLITNLIQTTVYAIFIRAGDPKPAPGSARHARDKRAIQIAVIVAYLAYTVYEADDELRRAGDFYQLLEIGHGVDEKGLLSRFRRLTVLHHPDKVAPSSRAASEELFVQLKLARDTLIDPIKRFAYDRFGPNTLGWTQACHTRRDYLLHGLQANGVWYIGVFFALASFSFLGYTRGGMFWRTLALVGLGALEVHVLTRAEMPLLLAGVLNPVLIATGARAPYLPFQILALARKIVLTLFFALAQLAEMLFPSKAEGEKGGKQSSEEVMKALLVASEKATHAADQELVRLMGLEMSPFVTVVQRADKDGEMGGFMQESMTTGELRKNTRDWLVQNTIRNDPGVKEAIRGAMARRAGMANGDAAASGLLTGSFDSADFME